MSDTGDDTGWVGRIGSRISIRIRLPDGSHRDVVGVLHHADPRTLTVHRDGPERPGRDPVVVVRLQDVVAARVVPPRPSRPGPPHLTISVSDLERVMAEHWRPPERGQLGEWLLRAARGFTGRGNSALPVGDPGLSAAEALVVVRSWYAARDLPPLLALPSTAADPADTDRLLAELRECPGGSATGQGVLDPRGVLPAEHAELAELLPAGGWQLREGAGALVLTCATRQLHGPVQLPPGLELAVTDEPDPDWLGSYRYRGQQLPPIARRLLLGADQQAFVSIRDAARTVAVARGSLARGWAGLTAVEVLPEYRRRGLAGNLLRAVAEWAWRAGAVSMYLQVGDANPNAIRLYRSCGFVLHHRYDYVEAG